MVEFRCEPCGEQWESLEESYLEAEELLVALEQRCMDGGTSNLDDIRAVLAKLRGA